MSEAHRLLALLDTCEQTLASFEGRPVPKEKKKLVAAIRDTCRDIEGRLTELGVPFADRTTKHFEESLASR